MLKEFSCILDNPHTCTLDVSCLMVCCRSTSMRPCSSVAVSSTWMWDFNRVEFKDKEMGTVLHFRTIRPRSRGFKQI
jgi:hypothetical protein